MGKISKHALSLQQVSYASLKIVIFQSKDFNCLKPWVRNRLQFMNITFFNLTGCSLHRFIFITKTFVQIYATDIHLHNLTFLIDFWLSATIKRFNIEAGPTISSYRNTQNLTKIFICKSFLLTCQFVLMLLTLNPTLLW